MKKKKYYFGQKINLYFDENFPQEIINQLKNDKWFGKKCKITSVFDEETTRKGDSFHFSYCKKKNYTLVTLDADFWNDSKYPFGKIPGIVILTCDSKNFSKVSELVEIFISFFSMFPHPKYFIGDSKFQISNKGCLMKGRDSVTGEVKRFLIQPGDSMYKVGKEFGWFD
jgi:predicted nuclease of predicted toxin-antitoxin system